MSTGVLIVDALVQGGLSTSKREARQFIADAAVSLNRSTITDESARLDESHFKNGIALLGRGKRSLCVLTLA